MVFTFRKKKLDAGQNLSQLGTIDEDTETRHLAFKSGFLSIKDRMRSLTEQSHKESRHNKSLHGEPTSSRRRPQYATLQEMFSTRTTRSQHEPYCPCDECLRTRKPKIPVMKLSKEDWNVKIWEDRLRRRQGRRSPSNQQTNGPIEINRAEKPKQQVEVFQGRIEDVAQKLDKVREGLPQDEKLVQLSKTNRLLASKSSQSWTSLLKEELAKGTHDPKQLKSEFQSKSSKSPLGRPIGKIFQESVDEEEEEEQPKVD